MIRLSHIRSHKIRKTPVGFTLIELMAALTAGIVAITATYAVSVSSTRFFAEQQQLATTQMNLRVTLDRLRRDISQAGYLGTPDSNAEKRCVNSVSRIRAIELEHDDSSETQWGTNAIPNATAHGVHADRLRLTGNYATSDSYLVSSISPAGNTVVLQSAWQGFRRSFHNRAGTYQPTLFELAFRAGRWIHIESEQGDHFFVEIVSAVGSTRTLTVTPSLPVGTSCSPGRGAVLSPLMRVEYRVVNPRGITPLLGAIPAGTNALTDAKGTQPSLLLRSELEMDSNDAVDGSQQVVGEYIVNFDVDFFEDSRATTTTDINAGSLTLASDVAAETATTLRPTRLRSALLSLSVRSPRPDPKLTRPPGFNASGTRQAGSPLTAFHPLAVNRGYTRVRNVRTEIFLPNLALRNL